MQDGQRLVVVVIRYLERASAPGAADFKRLAASMLNFDQSSKAKTATTNAKTMPSPSNPRKQLQPQLYRHNSASMSESDLLSQQEKLRRATLPNLTVQAKDMRLYGRTSIDSARSESPMSRRDHRSSAPQPPTSVKPRTSMSLNPPNLDYLSLTNTPATSQPQSPIQSRPRQRTQSSQNTISPSLYQNQKMSTATPTEWEVLLGSYDDRHLYDAIYGGASAQALSTTDNASNYGTWEPDIWDYTSLGMGDLNNDKAPAQSVLSFSEESLSSGDDLSASDLLLPVDYKNQILAGNVHSQQGYDYLLNGLDSAFGL